MPLRDRFRLAWELTWPLALIDVAFVLIVHGVLDVTGESADSIWAFLSFLTVSPWVVRRALRLQYGKLRITPALTYQQSLKVMWLLAWRTLVLSLVALLIISLVLKGLGVSFQNINQQSPLVDNLGLSAADALASIVFTPLLIPGMVRKQYRGFRLELIEEFKSSGRSKRR
jgi:hypothetical protein